MRTLCLAIAFCSALLSQSASDKQKAFMAELQRLQAQAKAAFDGEMAREKSGDCPNAETTRAIVDCLGKEIDTATANFKAFSGAIRAIISLEGADAKSREEQLKEFDEVGAAWDGYRKAQCQAAYDQYKGGTIAPVEAASCQLLLYRSRMREMNGLYEGPLRR